MFRQRHSETAVAGGQLPPSPYATTQELVLDTSDAKYPVFDKDGKYVYFTASTDSGPSLEPDIHSFSRPVSRSVYLAVLAKDQPSPLAPESDEEKPAEEKKGEEKKDETKKEETKSKEEGAKEKAAEKITVQINFENIGQRVLALPLPALRYIGLQVGKPGTLYALEAPAPGPGVQFALNIHRFDLKSRKSDVPLSARAASRFRGMGKRCFTSRATAGSSRRPVPWRRAREGRPLHFPVAETRGC